MISQRQTVHFYLKNKIKNLISDKKFSEILTGSAWALLAKVFAAGFGLISSIIIARFYGANVMGIVAVINSFLILASIITVMGTDTSILRLIPEHLIKYSPSSAFKVYRKTLYMVMGASFITGVLFFFCADLIADRVFSKPHLSFYFAFAAIFVIFKSLVMLNNQAVRGLKLIKMFAIMQFLPQGFNLLLLILLGMLVSTNDVPVYSILGSFALAGILGWTIIEYVFRKRRQTQDVVHAMPARDIFSISLPMLMTASMAFIIAQTGVIMLGMFRTEAEVGYYAIAVKLATLTTFILNAVNSMAAPKFSELFHSDKMDELFYVAKKSAKLIFWTTTPILLGFIILGKPLLSLVFGSEFAIAYPVLVLLSFGQFVNSISGSTGLFMNMTGNQKIFSNIMLFAALINIVLNYLLIPTFGNFGAAAAAMVSIIVWNVTTLIYIKIKFGKTTGYFPWSLWS